MNIFSGRLVIDIVTLVKPSDEAVMIEKAHAGLDQELFKELQLILGAKGYASYSIGGTLTQKENIKPHQIKMIESTIKEAKEDVYWVYNKSQRHTIRID